jgi:hypothetical protein
MATKRSPSDAGSDRPSRAGPAPSLGRRGLLGGVGLLIGGAGALAGVPTTGAAEPAQPARPAGGEGGGLTEHRRTYYRLARF